MKQLHKRLFSVMLAVALVIVCLPIHFTASAVSLFDQRVSQLRQKFPNGAYWNHPVYEDWQRADVLLANWNNAYGDSVTWTPCATHNGQPGYGQCDCNVFDGGMQCWGFANRIFYGIFGVYASNVGNRWDRENVAVGDWIRVENDQHSAVVLKRNGNTLTIVEGNRDGNCKIVWDRQINVSSITYFKHSPNWHDIVPDESCFSSTSCAWATENDAKIEAELNSVYYCTSIGFYYGTSTNNLTKYTEPKNENVKNIWYEMIGECGIRLNPATKYYFKFFIVTGGAECQSDLNSFTTKGSSTYTVTYNANGATSGTVPASQTKNSGVTLTLAKNTGNLAKTGYVLDGWATSATGAKAYDLGGTYTANANVTLYAHWVKASAAAIAIHNYTENKKVSYRTTITFSADVTNPVSGDDIHWFIDGQDSGTGETFTVQNAKKSFTVQAKYIRNGSVIAASEVENVTVDTSFVSKLIAVIRSIFGMLPKVTQSYPGI